MIIQVTQITPYALSAEDGMKLYKKINKKLLQKKEITIDFNGISLFAPPFFNASFGRLIIENGHEVFEKIKITNLDDLGKETLEYTQNMLFGKNTKRISEIIEKNIFDS